MRGGAFFNGIQMDRGLPVAVLDEAALVLKKTGRPLEELAILETDHVKYVFCTHRKSFP